MSRRAWILLIPGLLVIAGLFLIGESVVRPPAAPSPEEESGRSARKPPDLPPETGTASPRLPGAAAEDRPPLVVVTNVPGAEVTLAVLALGGESDPPAAVVVADGEGIARFDPPPEALAVAEIRGEARAPGYRTARGRMLGQELRLTLEPGVAIRGRVVDGATDSPVEGANVVLVLEPHAQTGPDGRFEAFVAEAGEVAVAVSTRAHLTAKVSVSAPAEDLLVRLKRGLAITGRVTFPDGDPLPGVLVQTDHRQAVTDEDGRYLLSGFDSTHAEHEVRCAQSRQRHMARGGDTGVDFLVEVSVARIRVVDERGRPFKRGRVGLRGSRDGRPRFAMTGDLGERGEYVVALPPLDELRISPSAEGWPAEVTTVELSGEPVFLDLTVVTRRPPPPGSLEVRAVDGEGAALPFVYATVGGPSGVLAGFRDVRVTLDTDGRGRIETIPPGHYDVTLCSIPGFLHAKGFGLRDVRPVEVPSGGVARIEGTIREGGRFRVTVRDAAGEDVAPGRIEVTDESGEHVSAVCVQQRPDGSWAPWLHDQTPAIIGRPLPPGRYTVRVIRNEEVAGEAEVTVRRGETAELTIRLER